jgi:hypothetical protein
MGKEENKVFGDVQDKAKSEGRPHFVKVFVWSMHYRNVSFNPRVYL